MELSLVCSRIRENSDRVAIGSNSHEFGYEQLGGARDSRMYEPGSGVLISVLVRRTTPIVNRTFDRQMTLRVMRGAKTEIRTPDPSLEDSNRKVRRAPNENSRQSWRLSKEPSEFGSADALV